ncbi:MAG: UvrB/UvrC motif-containing protein, partial [Peptococcaceae bacterium]|nr:UvrB/UvrC motif-containing protein [Peptococcaceae bacterium]
LHMNLKHLQVELEDAISAERYEDAAVLRDKISSLRKELEALQHGVEVYVYTCEIDLQGVRYTGRIPVQEESEWKSMH